MVLESIRNYLHANGEEGDGYLIQLLEQRIEELGDIDPAVLVAFTKSLIQEGQDKGVTDQELDGLLAFTSPEQRRQNLRIFLKRSRYSITPEQLGLKSRRSRKLKGLRREEVARLVGISAQWYENIEIGKGHPSPQVIELIAQVLQFDEKRRRALYTLCDCEFPTEAAVS